MNTRALSKPRPKLYVTTSEPVSTLAKLENIQNIVALDFMQHLPDMAWAVDEDGYLLNANLAFFKKFDLEPKRSVNKLIISLVPPEFSSRLTIQHRKVLNTSKSVRTNVRVPQQDDSIVTYHVHLFPLAPIAGRRVLAGIATISKTIGDQRVSLTKMGHAPLQPTEIVNKAIHSERSRIGQELHDNVNQILSSAALYIDSLQPVNDRQELIKGKGREYILLAIEEIRNLSRTLAIPHFDNKQFCAKINELVDDVRSTTSLDITYSRLCNPEKLGPAKKLAIFRIIQEQVKNILNHSNAEGASISLYHEKDNLKLDIRDNGSGFNALTVREGVGLSSIRKRVAENDGNMQLLSERGSGCVLTVTIPLDKGN